MLTAAGIRVTIIRVTAYCKQLTGARDEAFHYEAELVGYEIVPAADIFGQEGVVMRVYLHHIATSRQHHISTG